MQDNSNDAAYISLLIEGIDALDAGLSIFDAELRLIAANRRLAEFFAFPAALMLPGTPLAELFRHNARKGEYGCGEIESLVAERIAIARRFEAHHFERERPDGTILEVRGTPLLSGGFVTIYTDVSEARQRERALAKLSSELEHRVAERTAELAHKSALLEQVLAHIEHGITLLNKDLVLELCNPQFAKIMRMPQELAQPGHAFAEFIRYNAERGEYGPGNIDEIVAARVALARNPIPHHFERTRPDGSSIEVIGTPIGDGGFVTTYTDITERKRAEAALKESEQRFHDFARAASDWFFETDAELRFTYFSERFLEVTRHPADRFIGKRRDEVVAPEAFAAEREKWQAHFDDMKGRRPFRDFQYPLRDADGRLRHISVSAVPAFDAGGNFIGYRGTGRDVTELHEARESLQHMAHFDTLTDIPNRRYFEDALRQALARAERYRQRGAAVFFDLDHFKRVNDRHGHQAGDRLLQNLAKAMSARLRKTDFLARIGGDEFALICEDVVNGARPVELAEELIALIGERAASSHPDCEVGASAGVAWFDADGPDVDTLMRGADAAMYEAKAHGRGGVRVAGTAGTDNLDNSGND